MRLQADARAEHLVVQLFLCIPHLAEGGIECGHEGPGAAEVDVGVGFAEPARQHVAIEMALMVGALAPLVGDAVGEAVRAGKAAQFVGHCVLPLVAAAVHEDEIGEIGPALGARMQHAEQRGDADPARDECEPAVVALEDEVAGRRLYPDPVAGLGAVQMVGALPAGASPSALTVMRFASGEASATPVRCVRAALIEEHGYIAHVVDRREEADIKRRDPEKKARRWVVEVRPGWFNRSRKLLTRYEKLGRSFVALNHLAAAIIAFRKLQLSVNRIYG